MAHTTSPSLLLRIRNRDDHHSWEQFMTIYSVIVKDYCFQRRMSEGDTEDVIQEVMRKVSSATVSYTHLTLPTIYSV